MAMTVARLLGVVCAVLQLMAIVDGNLTHIEMCYWKSNGDYGRESVTCDHIPKSSQCVQGVPLLMDVPQEIDAVAVEDWNCVILYDTGDCTGRSFVVNQHISLKEYSFSRHRMSVRQCSDLPDWDLTLRQHVVPQHRYVVPPDTRSPSSSSSSSNESTSAAAVDDDDNDDANEITAAEGQNVPVVDAAESNTSSRGGQRGRSDTIYMLVEMLSAVIVMNAFTSF